MVSLPVRRVQRRDSFPPSSLLPPLPLPSMVDPFRSVLQMMQALAPLADFDVGPVQGEAMFQPDFDLKERAEAYLLCADLPGVKTSDVDISVTGNRLTISGKREAQEPREGETWHACEANYGNFVRTVTLPEGADLNAITATMNDGVLELSIPKSAEVQPHRVKIETNIKEVKQITPKAEAKSGDGGEARP